jgi:hypothetical protein
MPFAFLHQMKRNLKNTPAFVFCPLCIACTAASRFGVRPAARAHDLLMPKGCSIPFIRLWAAAVKRFTGHPSVRNNKKQTVSMKRFAFYRCLGWCLSHY